MRATVTQSGYNGTNYGGEKETVGQLKIVSKISGKEGLRVPFDARFYMGRSRTAATVYCTVWVHGYKDGQEVYTSGTGRAGGYGYHKQSAALDAALRDAGVRLFGSPYAGSDNEDLSKECSISGCGSSSMAAAAEAVAKEVGAVLGSGDYIIID